jgi:hypothetical protein
MTRRQMQIEALQILGIALLLFVGVPLWLPVFMLDPEGIGGVVERLHARTRALAAEAAKLEKK